MKPQNDGDSRHHTCMIGWPLPATVTGSDNSNDPNSNPDSDSSFGLEYTSFTFDSAKAACISVYADPYGRIYNKQLRPVPVSYTHLDVYKRQELDDSAVLYSSIEYKAPCAVILGNETTGISEDVMKASDYVAYLPCLLYTSRCV